MDQDKNSIHNLLTGPVKNTPTYWRLFLGIAEGALKAITM